MRPPRTPAAATAAGDRTAAAPSAASGSGRGRAECRAEAPPALPLLEAVRARARRRGEAAFHVPGHRRGRGAHRALRELFRPASADPEEGNEEAAPGGFSPPSSASSSPPSEWEEEESASPHAAYGALGADTTELRGLDLLAAPRAGGPIAEAQALAAVAFGVNPLALVSFLLDLPFFPFRELILRHSQV